MSYSRAYSAGIGERPPSIMPKQKNIPNIKFKDSLTTKTYLSFVQITSHFYLTCMKNQHRGNRVPHQRRNDNTHRPPRKFSRDQPEGENQQNNRPFKKRFIKRDQDGKPRIHRRKDDKAPRKGGKGEKRGDDRDLDRELRDYWLTQKGNKAEQDIKEIAREKLNSELDSYWKQKREQAEPKAN